MEICFSDTAQRRKYVREADIAFPNTQWFNTTISNIIRGIHGLPLLLTTVQINISSGIRRNERAYETRIWGPPRTVLRETVAGSDARLFPTCKLFKNQFLRRSHQKHAYVTIGRVLLLTTGCSRRVRVSSRSKLYHIISGVQVDLQIDRLTETPQRRV
jgi:hypothetical protein